MLTSKKTETSPLLLVLESQILPWVQQHGIGNIIVARRSWKEMQAVDTKLPADVRIERQTLKSRRVRVRSNRLHGGEAAQVDGYWPKDKLYSRRAPILGFVTKGIVAIPFGDYNLYCKTGHCFLVLPGTPHSDGSHSLLDDNFIHDGSREICQMMVRGNGVECWLSRVRDRQRVHQKLPGESFYIPHQLARQYLETITEEMTAPCLYWEAMNNALMIALITLLMREIQGAHAFQSEVSSKKAQHLTPVQDQTRVDRVKEYVQSHLHENLTIDKVAKHFYVSRANFTQMFRAETEMTFVEYLTQCRVEAAKVLLHDTQWPIDRIGEVVGLKPSRFRAIFHEFTGMPPSAFRTRIRGENTFLENASKTGTD